MENETELLQECKLQLEYLNKKFGETGTTNNLLSRLDTILSKVDVGRGNNIKHTFERGDIISNSSKKDVRLILKAEDRMYHFINLKLQSFKDIFDAPINIEKGIEASQHADIVEKHFHLVKL